MKIVLVTGGFDPLHSGHISYFKKARHLGDLLIVGLNSDEWLERKKGKSFMPWNERLCIINNLSMVDEVYTFDDSDNSAKHFIQQVRAHYPTAKLIFANGGDRTAENIPEISTNDTNIEFVFGVGGANKRNSSSQILENWRAPKTNRPWGYYRVLHDVEGTKVKELTIDPGQSLSLQRHKNRQEFWHVTSGKCIVEQGNSNPSFLELRKHDQISIPINGWHRLYNSSEEPCKIVEIQFGISCDENDIERF